MKYVIFGAGGIGRQMARRIAAQGEDEVIAFLDNDRQKQGLEIENVPVISPDRLFDLEYDKVFITSFVDDITDQLLALGVDGSVIEANEEMPIATRKQWLVDFAAVARERGIKGNTAEAGVFRGDFAKHINAAFPDRTLYLFDTFEGFPESDIADEAVPSAAKAGNYGFTSIDVVVGKLPFPDKAVIKKGYFPESAAGVSDAFCFVNLDLDLYRPTLGGLEFFWGKMSRGGVMLVHDFFGTDYPNVRTAVYDFEKQIGEQLKMAPIGDGLSIAVLK
jgi:hypothetical protein